MSIHRIFWTLTLLVAMLASPDVSEARGMEKREVDLTLKTFVEFSAKDGWGRPVITESKDRRTVQLWFSQAPGDLVTAVAAVIGEGARRSIGRIEAMRMPGQSVVNLYLARPVKSLAQRPIPGSKGVRVELELRDVAVFQSVSYAEMIPDISAQSMMIALEDGISRGHADCEAMQPYTESPESWVGWAVLKYGDCLFQQGKFDQAIRLLQRVARARDTPRVIVALAGLRLDDWPGVFNPWIRLGLTNKELRNLPVPILQEIHLRQARRFLKQGRVRKARRAFFQAVDQEILPSELEPSTHELRLHLMEETRMRDEGAELVRLFQDFAPPAFEHPAFFATVRLAALGYARLGFVEQAIALSDVILEPRGTVVDPELTTAMVQVLRTQGRHEKARDLEHAVPTELTWIASLSEDREVSPSTSLLLASWILDVWDEVGAHTAASFARPTGAIDPSQALGEARMAALVGARDCDALQNALPGSLPPDVAAFASLCHTANQAPMEALDVWADVHRDPLAKEDVFSHAVRRHATSSAAFFDELSGVGQTATVDP
jgi:tetratricopeptide (TPR) repeat protein